MTRISSSIIAGALLAATRIGSGTANAAFVFGGYQDRLVSVESGASDLRVNPPFVDSGQLTTQRSGGADFSPFDQTQQASVTLGLSSSSATAHQLSTTDAQQISAIGSCVAGASTGEDPGWGGGSGATDNTFVLNFLVDAPAVYSLTTDMSYSVSGQVAYDLSLAHITLTSPGGTILNRLLSSDPGGSSTMQLELDPGIQYQVVIEFLIGGSLEPGNTPGASFFLSADYSLSLTPVPPINFIWTGATNNNWTTLATDFNWNTGTAPAWYNSANRTTPNTATFDLATPASVAVNSNIDVGSITFTTGGWTLNAGTGVLAYGATGAINITTTIGTDTINAIIADGSTFGSGGGATSLTKSGAGTLILGAANTYSGGITVNAGTLLVSNTSGSATGTGNVTMNGGTLGGSGTISGVVHDPVAAPWKIHPSETLAPTSATTLTVGGLTTSSNATLDFNLVTPGAASVSDRIQVSNSNGLTLNGGSVAFTNHSTGAASLGYYKIMQYSGSIQGAGLSSLSLPAITNNVTYTLSTTQDPGFVDVHRGLLGDANDDGLVNFADFVLLSNNFTAVNKGWGGADFNNDGVTNFADFVILSNNFGATIGSNEMAAAGAASGVPEPTSLVVLGAGLLGVFGKRRRCA